MRNDALKEKLRKQRPDYVLNLSILTSRSTLRGVECAVLLPKRVEEKPYLLFDALTEEQQAGLMGIHSFAVNGRIKQPSRVITLTADEVFCENVTTEYWSSNITHRTALGEPRNLEVTTFLEGDEQSITRFERGEFWLTRSVLLQPASIHQSSFTGEVRVEVVRSTEFQLDSGPKLKFGERFNFETVPEGTLSFSELVAGFEQPISVVSWSNIVRDVDDVLLLASFAERHRVVCLGWYAGGDGASIVQHYRRGITVPPKREASHDDTLIDIAQFPEFLEIAYRSFREIDPKGPLRHGIYGALAGQRSLMEPSILSMFAGLESLMLFYRRRDQLEFLLSDEQWKILEIDLRKWLKTHSLLKASPEKRKMMYEKLKELNRPAFKDTFERLVVSYSVDVSDLWPVCGRGSLLEIRNRIIHGELFTPAQQLGLITAKQNLQWVLERLLLGIMKWPIEKSQVSSKYLSGLMCAFADWPNDRKMFM